MTSVVPIKNLVWTLAPFAFYKPNSIWNPSKTKTASMCSSCYNLVNQCKWPTKFQLFISKFLEKKYNLTKKEYNTFFCHSVHPVQFKCFCFIFLPIPTSKCLNGAIINKRPHSYDTTALHSLNSSPPTEQCSHSPAKESLHLSNRQRWNYKWPSYFNYLNWSDRQILSPRRLHNLCITWQNLRISSITCRMSVKYKMRLRCRNLKEYFRLTAVFFTGIHAFKGASLLSLLVNLQIFGRALKTRYGATVFSLLESRSKLVTFTQALNAQHPSLSFARKIDWQCCRSL